MTCGVSTRQESIQITAVNLGIEFRKLGALFHCDIEAESVLAVGLVCGTVDANFEPFFFFAVIIICLTRSNFDQPSMDLVSWTLTVVTLASSILFLVLLITRLFTTRLFLPRPRFRSFTLL